MAEIAFYVSSITMKILFWVIYVPVITSSYANNSILEPISTTDDGITKELKSSTGAPSTTDPARNTVPSFCHRAKGFSDGQLKHCLLYEDHMEIVGDGIKTSLQECQRLFKYHKWNCTAGARHTTFFGPSSKFGNRENAFLQAVTSAGVMYAVARSCRDGHLTTCGCSTTARPSNLYKDFIWRGCGDNLEYAYKFTRNLMDVKEQERISRLKNDDKEYSRSLMALHNNEAGRRAVLKTTKISCKCHGVSGSCSLITCWHQLPVFSEIGDSIKIKYDSAIKVKKNKKGRLQVRNAAGKRSKVTDLVYVQSSPNYCLPNDTMGILGTENRECHRISKTPGNCDMLCCNRGYNIRRTFAREKCNCKFHWCCYVKCETCISPKEIYSCK